MKPHRLASGIAAGAVLWACGVQAQVQPLPQRAAAPQAAAPGLAPALRAAILGGNAQALQQALSSLSGGSPAQAAALARQVALAAESLAATQPQAAVTAAAAAVQVFQAGPVAASAPSHLADTLASALRLMAQPNQDSHALGQLALASAKAAPLSGNPAVVLAVGQQVMPLAERLAPHAPGLAVRLAGTVLYGLDERAAAALSPAELLALASAAARLISAPPAREADPAAAAAVAVRCAQVAVRGMAAAPPAAAQVVSMAHAAVTAPGVATVAPAAAAAVRKEAEDLLARDKAQPRLPPGLNLQAILSAPPAR